MNERPVTRRRPVRRKPRFPKWKYKQLVVALGSNDEISSRIVKAGFDPPPSKTIAGWRTRGSVPSKWLPLLVMFAEAEGLLDDWRSLAA